MNYDVIIVGAGAAGLSASIFTARRGLKTLIISKDLGGQTSSTLEIENYPGLDRIEGPQLMENFYAEAKQFGVQVHFDSVELIEKNNTSFIINTKGERQYTCDSLILALGKSPRKLKIPGEDVFETKGVWYGNIPEPEKYVGKTIAIIGGGSSAVQAALSLERYATHTYLIHRRDTVSAEEILMKRLSQAKHIEKIFCTESVRIEGDNVVKTLTVKNNQNGNEATLAVDGICIATGFETKTLFLNNLVMLDGEGRIDINQRNETSCEGIFAAGDATTVPFQQIVISAGEGAKAAISAYQYLAKKKGARVLRTDWGYLKAN